MIPDEHLHRVVTIRATATAGEAAGRMREEGVGALVVVDEDRRPVGVVTDRELALRVLRSGEDPRAAPAFPGPARPLVTIRAAEGVFEAARRMRAEGIRRLPIVDDSGGLVGIVTADDLLRHFSEDLHRLAQAVTRGLENESRPQPAGTSVFGKE